MSEVQSTSAPVRFIGRGAVVCVWIAMAGAGLYALDRFAGRAVLVAVLVLVAMGLVIERLVRHPAPLWRALVLCRWADACEACKVGRDRRSLRTRETAFRPAAIAGVTGDDYAVGLVVRVPKGMTAAAVIDAAPKLAGALGAVRAWGEYLTESRVSLRVVMRDPLAATRNASPEVDQHGQVTIGRDEGGAPVLWHPSAGHTILQGQQGSGKSTTGYGILGPLATCPNVVVCGTDLSGVTLGPWLPGAPGLIALGGRDLAEHVRVLRAIVEEMTTRLDVLAASGLDLLPISTETPWLVVVVEEMPGLIAATKDVKELAGKALSLVTRLKREGRKVRITVLTIAQRASAEAIGTEGRGQDAVRISHRVDSPEALAMLHSGADVPALAEVRQWPPGLGLVEMPGRRLSRFRADLIDYATYRATVAAGLAHRDPFGPLPEVSAERGHLAIAEPLGPEDGGSSAPLPAVISHPRTRSVHPGQGEKLGA